MSTREKLVEEGTMDIQEASKFSGIGRTTLWRKLGDYGIDSTDLESE